MESLCIRMREGTQWHRPTMGRNLIPMSGLWSQGSFAPKALLAGVSVSKVQGGRRRRLPLAPNALWAGGAGSKGY